MERCRGQATMVLADHVNSWQGVELLIPLLKHTKYYYCCVESMCRPMPTRGKCTAIIFVSSHRKRLKIRASDASLDKRSRVPVCPTPHFFTYKFKIYEASSEIRRRLWTHCLSAHRTCWELWCQLSAFSLGKLHHLSSLCPSAVPRELVNYFWAA